MNKRKICDSFNPYGNVELFTSQIDDFSSTDENRAKLNRSLYYYRKKTNIVAIQQVIFILIISKFGSCTITRPHKQSKTHFSFFEIVSITLDDEEINFKSLVDQILSSRKVEFFDHNIKKKLTDEKRDLTLNLLEDICFLLGVDFQTASDSKKILYKSSVITHFKIGKDIDCDVAKNLDMFQEFHKILSMKFNERSTFTVDNSWNFIF